MVIESTEKLRVTGLKGGGGKVLVWGTFLRGVGQSFDMGKFSRGGKGAKSFAMGKIFESRLNLIKCFNPFGGDILVR